MADDRALLQREMERVELRPFTLDRFHRRRERKLRYRQIGTAVVALAMVAVAFGGLARALTPGRVATPAEQPTRFFLGRWTSTDADGSSQTMTILATGEETYEMVLHDDFTGPCSGSSTDTGTGRLEGAGTLVIRSITMRCDDGRVLGSGDLIFVHDPETDTITDDFGVVWSRE
jgi:hypothetical protein